MMLMEGFSTKKINNNATRQKIKLQSNSAPLLHRLHRGKLHGRSTEIQKLQDALYKSIQHPLHGSNARSQTVWISGVSGVGKTSLVLEAFGQHKRHKRQQQKLLQQQQQQNSGNYHHHSNNTSSKTTDLPPHLCFVTAKFEQTPQRSEPFSALMEAFVDLYCAMEKFDREQRQSHPTITAFTRAFGGSQLQILAELTSKLSRISAELPGRDVFGKSHASGGGGGGSALVETTAFLQFRVLCRVVLRSAASAEFPVVLFLDDLHWADKASLLVLETLIQDNDSKNVLLVGAFREEELNKNKALRSLVRKTAASSSKRTSSSSSPSASPIPSVEPFASSTSAFTQTASSSNGHYPPPQQQQQQQHQSPSNSHHLKHRKRRRSFTKHPGKSSTSSASSSGNNNNNNAMGPPAMHIVLRELTVESLHKMIQAVTNRRDEQATMALSRVVWSKTHGNAYFVVQFLQMLVHRRLLVVWKMDQHSKQLTIHDNDHNKGNHDDVVVDDDVDDDDDDDKNIASGNNDDETTASWLFLDETYRGVKLRRTSPSSTRSGAASTLSRPYVWNIDRVQKETNVSDNVADLLAARIKQMAQPIQTALKVAAFLGFTIQVDILHAILINQEHTHSLLDAPRQRPGKSTRWTRGELDRILNVASKVGFLEKKRPSSTRRLVKDEKVTEYNFMDDRVRSVCYELIPAGRDREILHLQIGRVLVHTILPAQSADWLVPMAADHLNRGGMHMISLQERIDLVRFNLRVGKYVMSRFEFVSAAEYIKFGIALFGENYLWENHFDLALDLLTTLAEAYYCAGNLPGSREVIHNVMAHTQNIDDRLRAYYIQVESLGAGGHLAQARRLALSVLEELGVSFPKKINKMHVMLEILKIQRAFKDQDPRTFLLKLPDMSDPKKDAAMKLLSKVATHTFMNDAEKNTFSLMGLRLMRLTVEHGLNEWSPCGIAIYAMSLTAAGKYAEGHEMGLSAVAVSEKLGRRPNEARHLLYLDLLVMHWQRPLTIGLSAFPMCYDISVQNGDVDTGLCATTGYLATALQCRPLMEVDAACRRYVRQMYEFDNQTYLSINIPIWQLVLNMLGEGDDPLILSGEAMEYDQFRAVITEQNHAMALQVVDLLHLILASSLNAYDRMKELLPRVKNNMKSIQAHFLEYLATFYIGYSYFSLFRRYRQAARYRRNGRRALLKLKKWARRGVVSCHPLYLLLHAINKSFEPRSVYASLACEFDLAIDACREDGLLPYEAMANEQVAMIAMDNDYAEDAMAYMQRSVELDEIYGFQAKTNFKSERLHQLAGDPFPDENMSIHSSLLADEYIARDIQ